ncbi:hypothetical protein [Phyllobacterium myrsinacearum]|uniref:Transposase-like protein n=1 Tax=Phyllobacterium myrsinacearum TaxID=28101 RepID=A0A839EWN6_9HYPH|nr:hypothetical protein [Phyllobacterium myrsinacearum]MBA8881716.1 transposase-like protein [Phyllobacterium myrsinacearum]
MSEEALSGTELGEDAEEAGKKFRKLTPAERAEIRELYELGKARMTELADKYGCSRQTLSRWFRDEKIKWGSRAEEVKEAAKAAITASTTATVTSIAERFQDHRADWIEETRVNSYKALRMAELLAKKTVQEAMKAAKPLATIDEEMKAIHRYQKVLLENADARLRILNADDVVAEDDLPSIQIDDLTAEDLVRFHRENGVDDEEEIDEILKNFDEPVVIE